MKYKPLQPAEVRAYLEALFMLARHGNTFAKEANELINEVSAPEVILGEVFVHIHNDPHGAFESALQQAGKRAISQLDR